MDEEFLELVSAIVFALIMAGLVVFLCFALAQ